VVTSVSTRIHSGATGLAAAQLWRFGSIHKWLGCKCRCKTLRGYPLVVQTSLDPPEWRVHTPTTTWALGST
jgi:hypothetical protein